MNVHKFCEYAKVSVVFFFFFFFGGGYFSSAQMWLVKDYFKIFVIINIIGIICQVTPSVALSNVTTVKMCVFFFFFECEF